MFCPAVTVAVVLSPDGADMLKSSPVPVSGTFCGLSPALSVRVRNAVRVPDAVGENVTVTLQVPPEATAAARMYSSAQNLRRPFR